MTLMHSAEEGAASGACELTEEGWAWQPPYGEDGTLTVRPCRDPWACQGACSHLRNVQALPALGQWTHHSARLARCEEPSHAPVCSCACTWLQLAFPELLEVRLVARGGRAGAAEQGPVAPGAALASAQQDSGGGVAPSAQAGKGQEEEGGPGPAHGYADQQLQGSTPAHGSEAAEAARGPPGGSSIVASVPGDPGLGLLGSVTEEAGSRARGEDPGGVPEAVAGGSGGGSFVDGSSRGEGRDGSAAVLRKEALEGPPGKQMPAVWEQWAQLTRALQQRRAALAQSGSAGQRAEKIGDLAGPAGVGSGEQQTASLGGVSLAQEAALPGAAEARGPSGDPKGVQVALQGAVGSDPGAPVLGPDKVLPGPGGAPSPAKVLPGPGGAPSPGLKKQFRGRRASGLGSVLARIRAEAKN